MLRLFGNEDYIYTSEIHPVPDPPQGEACGGSARSASHCFCFWAVSISWMGWVCHCSLEKDKKDTPLRPGKPPSYKRHWGFILRTMSLQPAGNYIPRSAEANVFGKEASRIVDIYREPFLLGPSGSQPKLLLLSHASHPPFLLLHLTELGEEEPGFLYGLGIINSHFQWQE